MIKMNKQYKNITNGKIITPFHISDERVSYVSNGISNTMPVNDFIKYTKSLEDLGLSRVLIVKGESPKFDKKTKKVENEITEEKNTEETPEKQKEDESLDNNPTEEITEDGKDNTTEKEPDPYDDLYGW